MNPSIMGFYPKTYLQKSECSLRRCRCSFFPPLAEESMCCSQRSHRWAMLGCIKSRNAGCWATGWQNVWATPVQLRYTSFVERHKHIFQFLKRRLFDAQISPKKKLTCMLLYVKQIFCTHCSTLPPRASLFNDDGLSLLVRIDVNFVI